jgi:hypothetical protein
VPMQSPCKPLIYLGATIGGCVGTATGVCYCIHTWKQNDTKTGEHPMTGEHVNIARLMIGLRVLSA